MRLAYLFIFLIYPNWCYSGHHVIDSSSLVIITGEGAIEDDELVDILPNLLDLGGIEIIPAEKIEIDGFEILSNDQMIISDTVEFENYIEYGVLGFDDDSYPKEIDPNDIQIYQIDPLKNIRTPVEFVAETFRESNKIPLFEILLDDSGSMAGDPITELVKVFERFISELSLTESQCRVVWFSTSHRYFNRIFQPCDNPQFRSISIFGEYQGTDITPALKDTFEEFSDLGQDKFQKNVIIVSDGHIDIDSYDLAQFQRSKAGAKIFVYIIGGLQDHALKQIGDYFLSATDDLRTTLAPYLKAIDSHLSNQVLVRIQKEDIDIEKYNQTKK